MTRGTRRASHPNHERTRSRRRNSGRAGAHPAAADRPVEHLQALRTGAGADRRVPRGGRRRGPRPARRERGGQVDADERRLGHGRPRQRHDRGRRRAIRAPDADNRRPARHRHRPPASGAAAGHDRRRERPRRPAPGRLPRRSAEPDGDSPDPRRGQLQAAPRRPRRLADGGRQAPPRARQGAGRQACRADPRRADCATRPGVGGDAVRPCPPRRRGRVGGHLHHPPAGRGARRRRPRDDPARRRGARRQHRRGDQRRRAAPADHRPPPRIGVPPEVGRGNDIRRRSWRSTTSTVARSPVSRCRRVPARSSASPASSATARASCCAPWPVWSASPGRSRSPAPTTAPPTCGRSRRTCRRTATPRR